MKNKDNNEADCKLNCKYSDSIPRMEEKLNQIHDLLTGDDGLIKQVKENTIYRIQSQTRDYLIRSAVGGGWLITILGLLYTIFFN